MSKLGSMNKKFLTIFIGIIGGMFLIILIIAVARSCGNKKTSDPKKIEEKLEKAAKSYYGDHKDKLPEDGQSVTITDAELTKAGYFKGMSKVAKDSTCVGSVTVHMNAGQKLAVVDLKCKEYQTEHLQDRIIKDNLVDGEILNDSSDISDSSNDVPSMGKDYIDGLYKTTEGYYVFRGSDPKNNLVLNGEKFKIIDISPEGIIRMVDVSNYSTHYRWDTKYNVEAKRAYGINDYKNSEILKAMKEKYGTYKDNNKTHLAPFSVCIGKRNKGDENTGTGFQKSLERSIDCSEVLEGQYMGLLSVSDFARASLDENCTTIGSPACVNYNYLSKAVTESWTSTGLANDTYTVLVVSGGIIDDSAYAKDSRAYYWVNAVYGDEVYISGNGTESDPYVVGSKG